MTDNISSTDRYNTFRGKHANLTHEVSKKAATDGVSYSVVFLWGESSLELLVAKDLSEILTDGIVDVTTLAGRFRSVKGSLQFSLKRLRPLHCGPIPLGILHYSGKAVNELGVDGRMGRREVRHKVIYGAYCPSGSRLFGPRCCRSCRVDKNFSNRI